MLKLMGKEIFAIVRSFFKKKSFQLTVRTKNSFLFSSKTYVVGTQKNRLNKTVLLSTQNICQN